MARYGVMLLGFMAFIGTGLALAQGADASLMSLLNREQPGDADVLYLRSNDVLRGTVINERFTIKTLNGEMTLPLRQCAGISFGIGKIATDTVVTIASEQYTGRIIEGVVRFLPRPTGTEMGVPRVEIRHIVLCRGSQDRSVVVARTMGTQGQGTVTATLTKTQRTVARGTLSPGEDPLLKAFPNRANTQPAMVIDAQAAPSVATVVHTARSVAAVASTVVAPEEAQVTIQGLAAVPVMMRVLPAGSFVMGASLGEKGHEDREWPSHKVTITKPFAIGVYEVTQRQWQAVMGYLPSRVASSPDHPVTQVSWGDVQMFIAKLNAAGAGTFRLPTEAEWEYACRAGTDTRFYWGDDLEDKQIEDYAWFKRNSGGKTRPVGQKKANAWGFHDMSGNVWEWCQDWRRDYSSGEQVDPVGPRKGFARICRGGSWGHDPRYSRSANRNWESPDIRGLHLGFRLAMSVE